ncbi:MAG: hypothetical protein HC900_13495 [Methylacidiphilales bacterium]|nr:hypothetical protein [Candidatus Methylacidiphilales bacterium]
MDDDLELAEVERICAQLDHEARRLVECPSKADAERLVARCKFIRQSLVGKYGYVGEQIAVYLAPAVKLLTLSSYDAGEAKQKIEGALFRIKNALHPLRMHARANEPDLHE